MSAEALIVITTSTPAESKDPVQYLQVSTKPISALNVSNPRFKANSTTSVWLSNSSGVNGLNTRDAGVKTYAAAERFPPIPSAEITRRHDALTVVGRARASEVQLSLLFEGAA